MRVLGIDCGTEYTGYGVVELCRDGKLVCLTCGAVKLSPREPMAARLSIIFDRLGAIIIDHRPDRVAIEDVFYALNGKPANSCSSPACSSVRPCRQGSWFP